MLSAVKADSTVTALSILTFHPDTIPSNQLLVVADASGELYIFTSRGQLIFEHSTGMHLAQEFLLKCLAQTTQCESASLDAIVQHLPMHI